MKRALFLVCGIALCVLVAGYVLQQRAAVRAARQHATRAEITITIPEGSDLRDIANILIKKNIITTPAELYQLTGTPGVFPTTRTAVVACVSLPENHSLEGYLFPDTYRVYADATVTEVVSLLTKTFCQKLTTLGVTDHIQEIVTLASLLEAEVQTDADRRTVADIFLRRNAQGIALQSDATVHYAYPPAGSVYTTAQQRAKDTPWNTYFHRGLPVTPIANPGVAAITAALHPTPNNAWYFLTGKDGVVHYARTLQEQQQNKKFLP